MDFLISTGNVRTLKWRAYEGHLSKFLPTNGPSLTSHIYHYYYYYYYDYYYYYYYYDYYYYGMAAQFPALASSVFSSQIIQLNVFSHNLRPYNFENEMGGGGI